MQVRDAHDAEPAAIAAAADLAGRRVLEVGCGDGRLTRFAAEHAAEVYAFDPDAGLVAKAQAALPADLRQRAAIRTGLFELLHTAHYRVAAEYGDGRELVDETRSWPGTRVDDDLAALMARTPGAVRVAQAVRLRVLRAR